MRVLARAPLFVWTMLAVVALFPPGALASRWMTDAEIDAAFRGRTIVGTYYNGEKFSESYALDGSLSYREGADYRTGHWSVVNATFCTIYDVNPTGGCFRVIRKSLNCFEFYFVARTREQARQLEEHSERASWTARAWHNDQPSTCDEVPAV